MSPKYRVLLAVLLTLMAICSRAVFGQTKVIEKIVHVDRNTIDVSVDNLKAKDCLAGLGSITITPSGGAGKYTYAWTGPGGYTSNKEDITGLQNGDYALTLSDGAGCSITRTWTVGLTCTAPCSLFDNPILKNTKTCSSTDGSIGVTVTGGSGTYSYTWYNNNFNIIGNTKDLSGLAPGAYYLEVSDAKTPGCTTFFYYSIESSFKVTATLTTNSKCASPFTGSIAASVTGGSGSYTYQWQHPNGTKTTGGATLTGIRGGNYQVTVTDKTSGCSIQQTVYLSTASTATLAVSEAVTSSTACSPANGAIDITVANGSGDYTYTWYNQTVGAVAGITQDLTAAPAASYSIYVVDNLSGCSAYKAYTVPASVTKPAFTASATDNTSCSSPYDGSIELSFTTSGQYDVRWSHGATAPKAEGLPPGTYSVEVTDKVSGCKTEIPGIIVEDRSEKPLSITIESITANTSCVSPNGSIQATVTGASPSFEWRGPKGFKASTEDLMALDSGTYILTASLLCNTPPVIVAQELTTQTNSTIWLNLLDIISDPDGNLDMSSVEIVEMPQSGALASIVNNQLNIQYKNSFKGMDNMRLRACDVLRACSENTVQVQVEVDNGVMVYNAVAPQSTGDNKFMRIDHLPVGNNRVMIFNRWGDKVFEIDNYINDIPGKRFEGYADSGRPLPTGTYFYRIELADNSTPLTGYLSLKQ